MKINILTRLNGVGLQRDAEIISALLKDHETKIIEHGQFITDADLHIFLEVVSPIVNQVKGKKILIPNPEWFLQQWKQSLKHFDAVFCKTLHSVEIFTPLHDNVIYCGFTSVDRMDESIERQTSIPGFFPGKSKTKGTGAVRQSGFISQPAIILPDTEFARLFNNHSIHLCPSECEGWGHYIWEAFSVGAYVITTDAPPMNEADFVGAKVKCRQIRNHGIAPMWRIDRDELALAVKNVTPELIAEARIKNRELFLRNDIAFKERFIQLINKFI